METEQIFKKVDWLDEERRKDKNLLHSMEERITAMEGNIQPLAQQMKDLSGEIARLTAMFSRMDDFDSTLLQQRVEAKQYFEELERQFKKRDEESEKAVSYTHLTLPTNREV